MTRVVALVLNAGSRVRIAEALRGRAHVQFCDTRREMLAAVPRGEALVALVQLKDGRGASTLPLIRDLRRQSRSLSIIVYCELAADDVRALLGASRAGATSVVLRGHDDVGRRLRAAVARAEGDSIASEIMQELRDAVPARMRVVMRCCLRSARAHLTAEAVARQLGVHRNTVANHLSAEGLPALRELIGWSQLIVAAYLLERASWSVNHVAREMAFSSGAAFRGLLQRYTGFTPRELRQAGGYRFLLDALRAKLPSSHRSDPDDRPLLEPGHAADNGRDRLAL